MEHRMPIHLVRHKQKTEHPTHRDVASAMVHRKGPLMGRQREPLTVHRKGSSMGRQGEPLTVHRKGSSMGRQREPLTVHRKGSSMGRQREPLTVHRREPWTARPKVTSSEHPGSIHPPRNNQEGDLVRPMA